jgi:hypothetical protein
MYTVLFIITSRDTSYVIETKHIPRLDDVIILDKYRPYIVDLVTISYCDEFKIGSLIPSNYDAVIHLKEKQ